MEEGLKLKGGECPQCSIEGRKSIFQVNRMDLWECPHCRLQLRNFACEYIGIEKVRGNGELKDLRYDPNKWGDKVLTRKALYDGDDCIIKNEEELKEYLSLIK